MKNKKKLNNKGFSLVELIIVVAIMAVLVGVLAPQYVKYVKTSKVSTDASNADAVATAINVAIADGSITISTDGTTIAASDLGTSYSIANLTAFPTSKVDATYAWVVTVDTTGVRKITLGGAEIYPDAGPYKTANP